MTKVNPHEITPEEAPECFEHICQRNLGINSTEFVRNWRQGLYGDDPDDCVNSKIMRVGMLMGLIGEDWANYGIDKPTGSFQNEDAVRA